LGVLLVAALLVVMAASWAPAGPTPVMTLHCGVSNRTSIDGIEVPPPPMTMCTVPAVVSTTSVRVATGFGVMVSLGWCPRMGWDRS